MYFWQGHSISKIERTVKRQYTIAIKRLSLTFKERYLRTKT